MITRSLIRTKVLQCLYALRKDEDKGLKSAVKELLFSMDKAYELYISIFQLSVELTKYHTRRINSAYRKYFPSEEERNPNLRLANNRIVKLLSQSKVLKDEVERLKISFSEENVLLKGLLDEVTGSMYYRKYLSSTEDTFEEDREFWIRIFTKVFIGSEHFMDFLEEKSIFWNDDLDTATSFAAKTLKSINEGDTDIVLSPKYTDAESEDFAKQLLEKSYINQEEYNQLIAEVAENWEVDRLAFIDMLLLQIAISEILYFPAIPVAVTMNEYIEISKYYSTPRSGIFINGMLDKIVSKLRNTERITK